MTGFFSMKKAPIFREKIGAPALQVSTLVSLSIATNFKFDCGIFNRFEAKFRRKLTSILRQCSLVVAFLPLGVLSNRCPAPYSPKCHPTESVVSPPEIHSGVSFQLAFFGHGKLEAYAT